MLSQAITFLAASRGGVELGINFLIWIALLNIALKLTWRFATSERTWVGWLYLFLIGIAPFVLLATCIVISPWFDWLRLFSRGKP